jgi:hypothetical protein
MQHLFLLQTIEISVQGMMTSTPDSCAQKTQTSLKHKYNKLSSIGGGGSDTVYGELKLSEKLSGELGVVRDQVNNLQESLEEALFLN